MADTKRIHRFSAFSADYFRTISPAGVRQRIGLCGLDYPGCWDTKLNPADGEGGGADRIGAIHLATLD